VLTSIVTTGTEGDIAGCACVPATTTTTTVQQTTATVQQTATPEVTITFPTIMPECASASPADSVASAMASVDEVLSLKIYVPTADTARMLSSCNVWVFLLFYDSEMLGKQNWLTNFLRHLLGAYTFASHYIYIRRFLAIRNVGRTMDGWVGRCRYDHTMGSS
jgi:hypothetical protein